MLLDSHALLWFVAGDEKRISKALRADIEAEATAVSAVSLWEIAIKSALGKLDTPDDLPQRVEDLGFEVLSVSAEHAWRVRELPRHHGDPFDRLLVVQAQVEHLAIFTADSALDTYDVEIRWG